MHLIEQLSQNRKTTPPSAHTMKKSTRRIDSRSFKSDRFLPVSIVFMMILGWAG